MTEINRPKLNLSALKANKSSTPKTSENQEKKASINLNTGSLSIQKTTNIDSQMKKNENNTIKKTNISINNNLNQKTNVIPQAPEKIEDKNENKEKLNKIVTTNKSEIKQTEINQEKQIINSKNENNIEITKEDLQETILKKEEELLKTENKNIEENEQKVNENGEIFSAYTSDFANKKEEALKESKKVKFPDSPKKIFFAIFTSLLILSSLALVIIFKVDKPVTNKLKTNILELVGKAEKKPIKPKITETWKKSTYNSIGFTINYEKSNTNKYKVDGKILNNKNEFNNYIKNKIEKLKLEKLKEHLQEEKVAN